VADDVILSAAVGTGATVATDDDGSRQHQYVKLEWGADNVYNKVTSTATNPLPVALSDVDNAVLDTIDAVLDTINAKLVTGTVIGDVNLGATDAAELVKISTATELIDDAIFADDAAFTLASSKTMVSGAIRDDTLSTLTAVEGDVVPFRVNSTGALHVTGDGGGTQYSVDDAGPTVVTMAGVVRDDSLTTLTEVDGDATVLRVNSTGALHVTGGGGGTEYNVDDAGPTVVSMAGVVRDDSLTTLTEADGDVSLLRVNSTGALHVTGGGGGTEYTEDVATANPIVGTATMMERDDALSTLTPIEGDWAALRCSAEGALWTQDFNSDAILADTTTIAGDTTSIDGKITACDTGAVVISSGTITAVTDITNTVTVDWAGTAPPIGAGVEATALRVTLATDSTGVISIDDGGNTITVDGTVTANLSATDNAVLDNIQTAVELIDNAISGSEMQVDVVAALPSGANTIGEVTIGTATTAATDLAKAQDVASGANDVGLAVLAVRDDEQAAMTPVDGDYTTLRTDKFGNLKVTQLPDATSAIQYGVIDAASSGDNTLQAAAGAGIKIRVLSAFMVSAGTVNARFESGAGGTALTGQMNLVANSGFTLPYNPAGWFETADNTLLNLELSAAISVDGCFTYVEV